MQVLRSEYEDNAEAKRIVAQIGNGEVTEEYVRKFRQNCVQTSARALIYEKMQEATGPGYGGGRDGTLRYMEDMNILNR